jgi:hypothetical protein
MAALSRRAACSADAIALSPRLGRWKQLIAEGRGGGNANDDEAYSRLLMAAVAGLRQLAEGFGETVAALRVDRAAKGRKGRLALLLDELGERN